MKRRPNANVRTETERSLTDTISNVLAIVKRRRWWILCGASFLSIAAVAVAVRLPGRYVSQATLMVIQQQVSQRVVEPDNTTTLASAIDALKLEVLSRARLLGIISDLGLYPELAGQPADLLAGRMLKDIQIEPLQTAPGPTNFNAFTVSFAAAEPKLAQQVTSRLTSLFIEQDQRTRGERATNTTKFLNDQLATAKQKFDEQEARLQAFKAQNLGELPEQEQANQIALTELHGRLQTATLSLAQIQQQRLSLELSLNDLLSRMQEEKRVLLGRYTPRHPEVVKKEQQIARIEMALDRLRTRTIGAAEKTGIEPGDDPVVEGILRQAEANSAQFLSLSQQVDNLTAESERYQKRLNMAPLREQQLAQIVSDDNLYRENYTKLLNQTLQSQLSANLEENQEGRQFKLIDPPSLPVTPAGLTRMKLAFGGLAGGLIAGFVLAFLIELIDTSFHDEGMLRQAVTLPFVVGIPVARTRREDRIRNLRIAFEWLAGIVMVVGILSAEYYVFKKG